MFKIYVLPMLTAAFAGIMIPTFMLPTTPKLTIKLLERFGLLKKDEVTTAREMHLTGAGYARNGLIYKYTDPNRPFELATKKVAIRLFSISIIFCVFIGAIAVLVFRSRIF